MTFYNKSGEKVDPIAFANLMSGTGWLEYKRVGMTELSFVVVSTVWLGIDHSFGEGKPLIFETMVFDRSDWRLGRTPQEMKLPWMKRKGLPEKACRRYSTEAEALAGHEEIVAEWMAKEAALVAAEEVKNG